MFMAYNGFNNELNNFIWALTFHPQTVLGHLNGPFHNSIHVLILELFFQRWQEETAEQAP